MEVTKELVQDIVQKASSLFLDGRVSTPTEATISVLKTLDLPVPAIERVCEGVNTAIYRDLYLNGKKNRAAKFPLCNKEEVIRAVKGKVATSLGWKIPPEKASLPGAKTASSDMKKAASAELATNKDYLHPPEVSLTSKRALQALEKWASQPKLAPDTLVFDNVFIADKWLRIIVDAEQKMTTKLASLQNEISKLIGAISDAAWRTCLDGVPVGDIVKLAESNPGIVRFVQEWTLSRTGKPNDLQPTDKEINPEHPLVKMLMEYELATSTTQKVASALKKIVKLRKRVEKVR